MATPAFGDAEFFVGYCPGCEKQVLTCIEFGPTNEERRLCVHCDSGVEQLRAVSSHDLADTGYEVLEARTCGNGGGCGSGGCGMRERS